MNSKKIINMDRRVLLAAIWIFVLFNMIYADIITMLTPGWLEQVDAYSKIFTWRTLLIFSILLEIPIAMTLLSRILNYKANRWTHTIAVPITILFVLFGGGEVGDIHPYYAFFATIEIVAMSLTVWLVWKKWPTLELSPKQ